MRLQTNVPSAEWAEFGPLVRWLGVTTIAYIVYYKTISDKFLLWLIPKQHHPLVDEKIKADPAFARLVRIQGTALINALVLVIWSAAILIDQYFSDMDFETSLLYGFSSSFRYLSIVSCAYFAWDVCICVLHYKEFGAGFLAHGFMSLYATLIGSIVADGYYQLPIVGAVFSLAELSTPFLHVRWLMLQTKQAQTKTFKITNLIFMATFIVMRILVIPIVVIWPLATDFKRLITGAETRLDAAFYGNSRRTSVMVTMVAWLILNVYWASVAAYNSLKQQKKSLKQN